MNDSKNQDKTMRPMRILFFIGTRGFCFELHYSDPGAP